MRKHLFIMCLISISLIGYSQPNANYNLDYGLKLGAANYLGDMGGYNKRAQPFVLDLKMKETRWSIGGYVRYKIGTPQQMIKRPWSIELQFNWIRISGADSLTTNYDPRKDRNLAFRNDIFQFNTLADWTFWENRDLGHRHYYINSLSAYVCGGISIMYQDPYAYNPNHEYGLPTWVNLHSLRTEKQLYNKPFHLIQPGIPLGVGLNYTFQKQYRIGWSFTWTETFTDYLDGVSGNYPTQAQWNTLTPIEKYFSNRIASLPGVDPAPDGIRGDPNNNDSFITTTINLGYVIRYTRGHHHRFGRTRYGGRSKF